jgi:hypothetical protein
LIAMMVVDVQSWYGGRSDVLMEAGWAMT